MNRLAGASSPYLEQHKDNPVQWWPWCDEAFAEAKQRNVPVLVSIGYATCHWCHVMAHECFEDEAVAAALNEAFVCIKVDREQRPDLDAAYMAFCQATRGNGGWPLNVWTAPDGTPFYAATYIPKEGRGHHPGILDVTHGLAQAWRDRRDELLDQGQHVLDHLAKVRTPGDLDPDARSSAVQQWQQRFTPEPAGFGNAPRFPMPATLQWLLGTAAQDHVLATMRAMRRGGIWDHVGGGWHRYSTDAEWLLPHFEKMLYDQALMVPLYAEAFALTGDPLWADTVRQTIAYVDGDLRRDDGLIASARDADADGIEGLFTTWTYDEVVDLIGVEAARRFGCQPEGNHDDEATRQPSGRNIIHLQGDPTEQDRRALGVLAEARAKRTPPIRDDKALADWNWLWVRALATAARHVDAGYVDDAIRLADLLVARFGLPAQHADDQPPFVDDQAFAAWATVTLFEATMDPRWLTTCESAVDAAKSFANDSGALRVTRRPDRVEPPVDAYDGALPSGNGVAAWSAARLWRITGESRWRDFADHVVRAFADDVNRHPAAFATILSAGDELAGGEEVVLVDTDLTVPYAPGRIVIRADPRLRDTVAWLSEYRNPGAYVCRDHACQAPVTDETGLAAALASSPGE